MRAGSIVRAWRAIQFGRWPLKLNVSGHIMLSVSVRQFRIVCGVALAVNISTLVPSLGLLTFTDEVRTLRKWAHFDAMLTGWPLFRLGSRLFGGHGTVDSEI